MGQRVKKIISNCEMRIAKFRIRKQKFAIRNSKFEILTLAPYVDIREMVNMARLPSEWMVMGTIRLPPNS